MNCRLPQRCWTAVDQRAWESLRWFEEQVRGNPDWVAPARPEGEPEESAAEAVATDSPGDS